jgi:hypothetical protein
MKTARSCRPNVEELGSIALLSVGAAGTASAIVSANRHRPSRSRVRRWGRPHPLPSEPDGHLWMHPAQASDNAPAWHDRARFHRPTTPLTERGRPIGLGVNLDGTSTEPATEYRRGAAPRAFPPASDLLCPPSRLAVGSHPPTPGGSQLAFARDDLATPIRPVTGRPSLPPPSFTRRPVGPPCGRPTLAGGRRAYHVAS